MRQLFFNARMFCSNAVLSTCMILIGIASPVLADSAPLAPQSKVRMTVVQWSSSKSQYERWDAISGEYTVSDTNALFLPFIGRVPVESMNVSDLADEIAKRFQEKISLVQRPTVTLEVLEYPPIYITGAVSRPGEYKFYPGLTVLQSLTMSGGPRRAASQQHVQTINLKGELQEIEQALLRHSARLARLRAEMAGTTDINFEQPTDVDRQYAAVIFDQERVINQTRANALERQSRAFTELGDLLNTEVDTLKEKLQGAEANVKSVEDQLNGVRNLVEQGLAITSRQLELERLLTAYRADRLDILTAMMRARQGISEARRNLEGLHDTRRSEIASELQSEQANFDQLKMKRETTQKLLIENLLDDDGSQRTGEDLPLVFTVSRRRDGQINQFIASETTTLVPGDVVKVTQPLLSGGSYGASPVPTPETEPAPDQASQ